MSQGEQNMKASYKVLASASMIVLWGILAFLGVEIRADVNAMRESLSALHADLAVTQEQIKVNTEEIAILEALARPHTREGGLR